jgi:Tfp pilus assembly protein PilF
LSNVIALWLLFAVTVGAQSPLETALALTRDKQYAAARKALQGVPEPANVPQQIAFHRLQAAIASGLGEPRNAMLEMRAALKLSPLDPKLSLATAVAEMQAGQFEDALEHARNGGSSPTALAITGDIEDKLGRYEAAANAYQAAVAMAPAQEAYRLALATELMQHQTFKPALAVLRQAQTLFPPSARILTLIGIAQYANSDKDEATVSFEQAIAADAGFDAAYRCLAQLLLESSAPPSATAVDLLCRWNAIACSAMRLRVAREQGDAALAQQSIATLEHAPAGDAVARCELGRGYAWAHQWQGARSAMEACVHLAPTPQNHYRLGLIYQKLGLADLAHRQMELRNQLQARMTEETAAGMNALADFKLATK